MRKRGESSPAVMMRALWLAVLLLAACASHVPTSADRRLVADQQAARAGWSESTLHAGAFDVASWAPQITQPAAHLTVYIEGDGLAWLSAERQSDDPTPLEPVALELALAQPSGARAYLARPCQFVGISNCQFSDWGARRFSPEIISAMDQAVTELKQRFSAHDLTLIGYSGGGSVAALLTERRSDVTRLITVAGNLSTKAWTQTLGLSSLSGSLDPLDQRGKLIDIAQWHFVGTRDKVVPLELSVNFASSLPLAHVIRIEGFDHQCCWVQRWPALWTSTDP